jgi:glyoxylase-like metal-dependent hydrolase (beta-lactamase superfamily II)
VLNLGDRVRALESDEAIPGLGGWQWLHTPGHAPGHVSLFRRRDGTLLAGDAITTMNLDSLVASVVKTHHVCGPPPTATYDWDAAADSVRRLADLQPLTIAAGHGEPMSSGEAVMQLAELAIELPRPRQGRYVRMPAVVDETGIVSLPPKPLDTLPATAALFGIVAASAGTLFAVAAWRRKKRRGLATAGTPVQAS